MTLKSTMGRRLLYNLWDEGYRRKRSLPWQSMLAELLLHRIGKSEKFLSVLNLLIAGFSTFSRRQPDQPPFEISVRLANIVAVSTISKYSCC